MRRGACALAIALAACRSVVEIAPPGPPDAVPTPPEDAGVFPDAPQDSSVGFPDAAFVPDALASTPDAGVDAALAPPDASR